MRRIKQTGFSLIDGTNGKYGCLMACLASIFEMPIAEVANPYVVWATGDVRGGWQVVEDWLLLAQGLRVAVLRAPESGCCFWPDGLWIAIVDSRHDPPPATHAVVFDGPDFKFDPYPDDEEPYSLADVRYVYTWVPFIRQCLQSPPI
jgi:hypothetical protein